MRLLWCVLWLQRGVGHRVATPACLQRLTPRRAVLLAALMVVLAVLLAALLVVLAVLLASLMAGLVVLAAALALLPVRWSLALGQA